MIVKKVILVLLFISGMSFLFVEQVIAGGGGIVYCKYKNSNCARLKKCSTGPDYVESCAHIAEWCNSENFAMPMPVGYCPEDSGIISIKRGAGCCGRAQHDHNTPRPLLCVERRKRGAFLPSNRLNADTLLTRGKGKMKVRFCPHSLPNGEGLIVFRRFP